MRISDWSSDACSSDLLCDGPASLISSLGGLSQHCLLASLDQHPDPMARYSPVLSANLSLDNGPVRVDLGISAQRQGFNRAVLGAAPRGYTLLDGKIGRAHV